MTGEIDIAELVARLERLENRGAAKQLWQWLRTCDLWQLTTVTLLVVLLLSLFSGTAWGTYTHYTKDPAYFDTETQTVIQDPYGVNEGAGSSNEGNHIVYWGPISPVGTWQDIAAAGWPYELTRTFLAARYPVGLPNHFHFDHDAAAQLLVQGLTVPALDRLFIWDEGYGALPTTRG